MFEGFVFEDHREQDSNTEPVSSLDPAWSWYSPSSSRRRLQEPGDHLQLDPSCIAPSQTRDGGQESVGNVINTIPLQRSRETW